MIKLNTKKHIWVMAVIVLLIFLHFTGIISPIENLIIKVFNPVFSSMHNTGSYFKITYNKQTDKRDLANLVKELKNDIVSLTVENARLKILDEENKILREYLKFFKDSEYEYVLGNIVIRKGISSDNLNQNIIIDKGYENGIESGSAVVSGETIIGKVIETNKNISEICLITNKDCRIAATIQNEEKTSGIIGGELGLTIKMEFIPQTEEVNIDDTVITSGLEKKIPYGLVIGKVTDINKDSNELWQSATIEPLINIDEVIIVSVLK